MSKIALITGITGQDGSYLAELLLKKNYNVFGLVRPNFSISDTKKTWRLKNCLKDIKLYKKSLFDEGSIKALVRKVKPDEIYHLAAQAYDG
jgi:GDPmannose 4,6-dehydratase